MYQSHKIIPMKARSVRLVSDSVVAEDEPQDAFLS